MTYFKFMANDCNYLNRQLATRAADIRGRHATSILSDLEYIDGGRSQGKTDTAQWGNERFEGL